MVGALLNVAASKANRCGFAFFFSVLTMAGVIITAAVSMFPFVMPSSTHPEQSLLMWDATSSQLTLNLMFYLALVFVTISLLYTTWSYYKMFGRLDESFVEDNKNSFILRRNNMLYAIWVVGVLAAVMVSAKLTIGKEKSGKFDE